MVIWVPRWVSKCYEQWRKKVRILHIKMIKHLSTATPSICTLFFSQHRHVHNALVHLPRRHLQEVRNENGMYHWTVLQLYGKYYIIKKMEK